MAYEKQTWVTGEVITEEKLNHMERGIEEAAQSGGGALIVTSSYVNGVDTMNKTVQEIYDALMSGTLVYYGYEYGTIQSYTHHVWLAPITYIFTYDSASLIRVVVQRPYSSDATAAGSSGGALFAPSAMVFEANSMNAYPTFYRTVTPTPATMIARGSLY